MPEWQPQIYYNTKMIIYNTKYIILIAILMAIMTFMLCKIVFGGGISQSEQTIGTEAIFVPQAVKLSTAETTLQSKIVVLQKKTITLAEWKNTAPKLLEKTINNTVGWAKFIKTYKGKDFNQIINSLTK